MSLNSNLEFEEVRATAQSARTTAERMHRDVRALEAAVGRHGHRGFLSVIAIVGLFALTGACGWWLNSQLKAQGTSLANLLGVQPTVDALSRRMNSLEIAVSTLPDDLKKVTGRVDALDKKVNGVQKAIAAKPAPAPAPAAPLNAELESNVSQLNERITTLQTQHDADTAQMDSLRNELASLRSETEQKIDTVKSSIPRDTASDVVYLRAAVDHNQSSIASLADQVDRDRHDFEVKEGRASEVVPGVLLTIKDTNVGHQEISGWIYIQQLHRFVYLKNQGLLQPIAVFNGSDKQPHEIVITRVRKNDAVGYVLSPKAEGSMSAGN